MYQRKDIEPDPEAQRHTSKVLIALCQQAHEQ